MLTLEERYRKHEFQLTDLEEQIIEYILSHRELVVGMSIQNLAKETFTVPNSIMRLMKKLEYEGFTQLKLRLKDELSALKKEESSFRQELDKTWDLVDEKMIGQAADWMAASQRLLVFGAGAQAAISELLVMNIKAFHKEVTFSEHRHENIAALQHFRKKDVVILLSQSGETEQTLDLAVLAKKQEARVIGISHFGKSRLSNLADLMLYCYAPKEETNGYNTTNFVPMAIVGRLLVEAYRKRCV
ncbi:DNA-binding MurR/RpiR family transcriptional regulator [Peribacillus deserti]|uniref:DNA-binding MurR/RpiR family transcriptional regulator n=1 Tax=Peribacillus deserti TaxID=673318 RepID=A0ABS2QHX1_9BACI|nr:MurR/RpiR family transcriptional regulator [Peribacillus deserti]MBM7692765.1 DNA-binding MurR/RpiR family transcriptional regulator [Peribacillus deserti]